MSNHATTFSIIIFNSELQHNSTNKLNHTVYYDDKTYIGVQDIDIDRAYRFSSRHSTTLASLAYICHRRTNQGNRS